MQSGHNDHDDIATLDKLMKQTKFGMLTTLSSEGSLHSRPMTLQEFDFDGDLWFFTGRNSKIAQDLEGNSEVCLSFSKPEDSIYISVSGRAELVENPEKEKQLWNPIYSAWFPEGLNDPNLALLRVRVKSADFWDIKSSKFTQLFGFAKAMVTGKPAGPELGEHKTVNIQH